MYKKAIKAFLKQINFLKRCYYKAFYKVASSGPIMILGSDVTFYLFHPFTLTHFDLESLAEKPVTTLTCSTDVGSSVGGRGVYFLKVRPFVWRNF